MFDNYNNISSDYIPNNRVRKLPHPIVKYIRRGETTTHTFKFPLELGQYEKILVTYKQDFKIVVEKSDLEITKEVKEDCISLTVNLSQEDTLKFIPIEAAVQFKFLVDDKVSVSKIFPVFVGEVLNQEVLKVENEE